MLAFNPRKRCTAEEALAHPYLEDIREIECEVQLLFIIFRV